LIEANALPLSQTASSSRSRSGSGSGSGNGSGSGRGRSRSRSRSGRGRGRRRRRRSITDGLFILTAVVMQQVSNGIHLSSTCSCVITSSQLQVERDGLVQLCL